MPLRLAILLSALSLLVSAETLSARVVRTEITSRQDVLGGKSFGDAGPYERIFGTVHFSLRVDHPHNAAIVDLKNAVNLRDGEVEFAADFMAIQARKILIAETDRCCLKIRTGDAAASCSRRWGRLESGERCGRCMVAAPGIRGCEPRMAMGRRRERRLALSCPDCEGEWQDNQGTSSWRRDAVEAGIRDSARASDPGQHWRQ